MHVLACVVGHQELSPVTYTRLHTSLPLRGMLFLSACYVAAMCQKVPGYTNAIFGAVNPLLWFDFVIVTGSPSPDIQLAANTLHFVVLEVVIC